MAILGLDIGTTACKAVAFNDAGNAVASSGKAYRLRSPKSGWAELDPVEVWEAVQTSVIQVARMCPEPIEAIGVSSQGEAVVALDDRGNPLSPIIVSFDRRSIPQTQMIRDRIGDERIYAMSGQLLAPMGTATKVMWLLQNDDEIHRRAAYFACVEDYILYRLGHIRAIDRSMAARTMLYDIPSADWSEEMLETVGIKKDQLAEVHPSGTAVGTIDARLATEWGLPQNVTLVTGGHDQPCAMLGSGATSRGEAAYSLGTTETLICSMNSFQPKLGEKGFPCYPHVIDGQFVTLAGNFTGGNLLQWFHDQFAGEERRMAELNGVNAYDLLLEQMPQNPSGLFVLPHFTSTGTPWNDPEGIGMIIGLQLDTTKGQLIRGLMEGVTYEILLNMTILRDAGVGIASCHAVGGGSRSSRLLQLKADVLGIPIVMTNEKEAACKGAALLAGKGIGRFSDLTAAWREPEDSQKRFVPNKQLAAYYSEHLTLYRRLYPGVKSIMDC